MLFGITMFLNVWGVIWRNQKIVIGNAENVAAGGEANPEAPAAAKRGRPRLALQHPVLGHHALVHGVHRPRRQLLPSGRRAAIGGTIVYWLFVLVLWGFIEASALGLHRWHRQRRSTSRPSTSTRTRSSAGFILLAVIWFVGWELLLPA